MRRKSAEEKKATKFREALGRKSTRNQNCSKQNLKFDAKCIVEWNRFEVNFGSSRIMSWSVLAVFEGVLCG